jgi:putative flippase GtrA
MTGTLGKQVPARVVGSLGTPMLDVVIPVYNEEADLAGCVRRLDAYLAGAFPYPYRITIADNASIDATPAVAGVLAAQLPQVRVLTLPVKGRGHALHEAWSGSEAAVLAYMDVDLSTDLAALLPLVAPLISGHSDVAIGTRLSRSARVTRGLKREVISRCYNAVLRGVLRAGFSDAQCGFKAIRRDAAAQLLPLVEDRAWFFDTELLVLAQRAGLRIHEVPVDWVDDPDSRVDIVATALADLKGVWRMSRSLASGRVPLSAVRSQLGRPEPRRTLGPQLLRFIAIGIGSTLAYLVLYALLRTALPSQAANMVSLLLTAIANTAINRRWTFGVQGSDAMVRHHLQGLLIFGVCLALTSSALALLSAFDSGASRLTELSVLVVANLVATLVRFVALRMWVFAG